MTAAEMMTTVNPNDLRQVTGEPVCITPRQTRKMIGRDEDSRFVPWNKTECYKKHYAL